MKSKLDQLTDQFSITEIDVYQLSAVKGKKTETPTSALGGTGVKEQNALVSSESLDISIADFLEYVKAMRMWRQIYPKQSKRHRIGGS